MDNFVKIVNRRKADVTQRERSCSLTSLEDIKRKREDIKEDIFQKSKKTHRSPTKMKPQKDEGHQMEKEEWTLETVVLKVGELSEEIAGLKGNSEKVLDTEYKNKIDRILDVLLENKKENEKLNKKIDDIQSLLREETEARQKDMNKMKEEIKEMKKEVDKCYAKIKEQENKERRQNLMIKGLEEGKEETWKEAQDKVEEMFREKLKIEVNSVSSAQRIGRFNSKSKFPRPVIVKFGKEAERRKILEEKGKLRGTTIFVEEDYPVEIRQIRKKLITEATNRRKEGQKAFVKYNKLIIDEETYKWDEENQTIVKIKSRNISKN